MATEGLALFSIIYAPSLCIVLLIVFILKKTCTSSPPRVASLDAVRLAPGNVLLEVHGREQLAQSKYYARYWGEDNLLAATVVAVCGVYAGQHVMGPSVRPGDNVLVRARKGFPIQLPDDRKLFVFNEWDIATNEGPQQWGTATLCEVKVKH